jgi:hypothetical protein
LIFVEERRGSATNTFLVSNMAAALEETLMRGLPPGRVRDHHRSTDLLSYILTPIGYVRIWRSGWTELPSEVVDLVILIP